MFRTTDAELFCTLLDTTYAGLEGIDKTFRENGLEAAEKQLGDFVRGFLKPEKYFIAQPNNKANDENFIQAEKILQGELTSCGRPHKFDDTKSVDWESNHANGYPEWTWQLSRHNDWYPLAKCYNSTGDEKYAQAYVDYLMSWYEKEPCPLNASGGATKCWRSIEAGIRATNVWHFAFHSFYKSEAVTDRVITSFLKSLCDHAYRLKGFNTSGNWLLMEMCGLAHISMLYPFISRSGEWLKYALMRMENELDGQLYPDGFQFELSTGYHGTVVENYRWLINMAKAMDYELPGGFVEKCKPLFEMYMKLCMPDWKTPALNDGYRAGIGWITAAKDYYPEDERIKWFVSHGKEGKMPEYTSDAMPYSGMAMMRTGWDDNAVAFFMESAPFGFGHQHEDKLNVVMFAYGKDVLGDLGNYAYDSSDMRKFITSTRAHNCALVDDMGQNRAKTYVRGSDLLTTRSNMKWAFTGAIDAVEGEYNQGFGPDLLDVTHKRKTVFFKQGLNGSLPFALVIDRFVSPDDSEHKYAVTYQMDVQPYEVNGSTFTSDFGDGVTMSVIGCVAPEIRVGQNEPYYIGWRPNHGGYDRFKEHFPAPNLQFVGCGKEKRIVTALYPSNDGRCALKDVVISDDFNDTRIKLIFDDGGEITVDENDVICSADSPEQG